MVYFYPFVFVLPFVRSVREFNQDNGFCVCRRQADERLAKEKKETTEAGERMIEGPPKTKEKKSLSLPYFCGNLHNRPHTVSPLVDSLPLCVISFLPGCTALSPLSRGEGGDTTTLQNTFPTLLLPVQVRNPSRPNSTLPEQCTASTHLPVLANLSPPCLSQALKAPLCVKRGRKVFPSFLSFSCCSSKHLEARGEEEE